MILNRRQFVMLAGAATVAPSALLEACGGSSTPSGSVAKSTSAAQMTITWWGNADRAKRTEKVMQLFEAKDTQYKLTDTWGPNSDYFNKLNTQIAGGGTPDIFQMDMKYMATYTSKGVLFDLSKFGADQLDLSDFDSNLLKEVKTKSGTFGLPSALNMFALLYNSTLLGKAGQQPPTPTLDWQAFADYCRSAAKGMPKGTWPVDDHSGDIAPFEGWVHGQGDELYTADGKLGFQKQVVLDWFNYWSDLRKAGACLPADIHAASASASQAQQAFSTGKAAMYMTHSNFLEQYAIYTKDTLGIGPYPKGIKRPSIYPKVSQLWCVSSKTRYPSQAVQFLSFSITDADAAKALGVERGAPPTTRARKAVEGTLSPQQQAELDYVSTFSKGTTPRTTFDPNGALDVTTALSHAAQSIQLSNTSPSAATDKFWSDANSALQ